MRHEVLLTELDKDIDEYTNDLTREMDSHLLYPNIHSQTYIYRRQINRGSRAIRYPGATRGSIFINEENCITKINLYDDTCFTVTGIYKKSVLEVVKKYVGRKLVFKE